jgi:hypothetical protein
LLAVTFLRWFLQDPPGVTSQKTAFFIVAAVKTSNPTWSVFSFLFTITINTPVWTGKKKLTM